MCTLPQELIDAIVILMEANGRSCSFESVFSYCYRLRRDAVFFGRYAYTKARSTGQPMANIIYLRANHPIPFWHEQSALASILYTLPNVSRLVLNQQFPPEIAEGLMAAPKKTISFNRLDLISLTKVLPSFLLHVAFSAPILSIDETRTWSMSEKLADEAPASFDARLRHLVITKSPPRIRCYTPSPSVSAVSSGSTKPTKSFPEIPHVHTLEFDVPIEPHGVRQAFVSSLVGLASWLPHIHHLVLHCTMLPGSAWPPGLQCSTVCTFRICSVLIADSSH
ncbi:hypothetical protein C8J57DRAFT_1536826 [Mycena rebaudengoi]|nr:hypothetical protein C8J57DRAFT_1536826 [Mycena rebaudengoi]